MVFFVQNQPPHQIFKGREVAWTLKNELRKQQSDFLIFRALEINTVSKSELLWIRANVFCTLFGCLQERQSFLSMLYLTLLMRQDFTASASGLDAYVCTSSCLQ